jgi:hypothetical protein
VRLCACVCNVVACCECCPTSCVMVQVRLLTIEHHALTLSSIHTAFHFLLIYYCLLLFFLLSYHSHFRVINFPSLIPTCVYACQEVEREVIHSRRTEQGRSTQATTEREREKGQLQSPSHVGKSSPIHIVVSNLATYRFHDTLLPTQPYTTTQPSTPSSHTIFTPQLHN